MRSGAAGVERTGQHQFVLLSFHLQRPPSWSGRVVPVGFLCHTCIDLLTCPLASSVHVNESRSRKSLLPRSHDLFWVLCSSAPEVTVETQYLHKVEFLEVVGLVTGGAR